MSLRRWLVLLSLLTLILPLAAYRYAQQIEHVLKQGQEETLLTTAQMLGKFVAAEPRLLYGSPQTRDHFDPAQGDLFAPLLSSPPLLDGFADEWPTPTRALPTSAADSGSPRVAVYSQALYAFVRNDNPQRKRVEDERVIVLTRDESGAERAWSISADAPGPVSVYRCDTGSPWIRRAAVTSGIAGIWRATGTGYNVELRIPLSLVGSQIALFHVDATGHAAQAPLGWLHLGSEALRNRLADYAPAGLRVSVVDTRGWLLARAGTIQFQAAGGPDDSFGEPLASTLLRPILGRAEAPAISYGLPYGMWGTPVDEARAGKPMALWVQPDGAEPSIVRAAVPIREGSMVIGAVVVEEAGERLLLLRDQALSRLVELTLMGTVISMILSLAFAGWLSHRIRRLGRAAANALSPQGRIDGSIPDQEAGDEIGDLARSYGALLHRVREYTEYLQTLGSKLSHELRTPLTIVSSSLENLDAEHLAPQTHVFVQRARDGAERLHSMLTAMSEATRVEQSIEAAERMQFDLTQLVASAGAAYRQAFPAARIETTVPGTPCTIWGAPELIAQMLDKLVDNAVDFCRAGGLVSIELRETANAMRLSVSNEGPALPADIEGKIFESMVSGRAATQDRPHLGLGLFIVRLIAEFHRGRVRAHTLAEDAGVIVLIDLPRALT